MIIKKALMILGDTQYDALNIFTQSMAEGFRENGVKVDMIDTRENTTSLTDLYQEEYDLVFSFNGMWDNTYTRKHRGNWNTVAWSFLVDHPLHHHTRLLQSHRNQIVSCVDRKHVAYVQRYYPGNPYVCHMPHGGFLTCGEKKFEDRRYDVSVFGSYRRPEEALNEPEPYSDAMGALIRRIIDGLLNNPEQSLEEELSLQLSRIGIAVSDDEFRDFMKEMGFIDRYVRNKRRHDVVEALINRGIRVDVFGNGWENFATEYKDNLHIHGAVSYEDSLLEMSESRIVLNIMPMFTDGSHERIFAIMGQRSICLTDRSRYLEEEFTDKEDLFFYSVSELDQLPELVLQILNRDYDVDRMIEKAYDLVAQRHLWRNRAKAILAYIEPIEIEEEPVVRPKNSTDDAFCRLMQYVRQTDEQLLYERMKGNYLFYLETKPGYAQRLGEAFLRHSSLGSWNPEEGDYGVLRKRAGELKSHMDRLLGLYRRLGDEKSKYILTNALLNWETLDTKYLSDILASGKEENIPERKTRSICHADRDILEMADEVEKMGETCKCCLRYEGNDLYPNGIVLYAKN